MNVALLGTHPLALELTRHLSSERGERLVVASDDPAEVFANPAIDVLILADWSPDALAVAERLSPRASLVIIPDARQGSSFAYSLVLEDQDGQTTLLPAFEMRFDPRVQKVRETIRSGRLGEFVSARFERSGGSPPRSSGRSLFSLEEALSAALPDADLLRFLLGEFVKVSAVQAGAGEQLANLTVTFGSSAGTDVFWTYRRGDHSTGELVIEMRLGRIRLLWDDGRLTQVEIDRSELPAPPSETIPEAILAALRNPDLVPAGERPSTWTDYMRAFDLVDGVRRSIRRRRTIDLHLEETSERSQFKTQMTAFGCAVAGLTLVGFVSLLAVGALFDPRDAQQRVAEGAGLVLYQSSEEHAGLTPKQTENLKRIRENYRVSPSAILIEGAGDRDEAARNRRETVVRELQAAGFQDAETRAIIRPLAGKWFARVMMVAWILLFLPLGAFLAMQGLLLIARSGAEAVPNDSTVRQDAGARGQASD